mmetsp:Transcript_21481/g.31806  ORF Transcript_21481/g.31806 Transcript_21481/m.31806 type:complete len:380 (+) Transcript_21481:143-1282(+)
MSRESYEQHTVYLTPLLHKHKSNQGIAFEDLQSAWNRLQKHCQPSRPLDEMNSLHKSLLDKYNSAAKSYYSSFLNHYQPPSFESLDSLNLDAYVKQSIQNVDIQEWRVEPKLIQEWFHQPLKNLLTNYHKKEELQRKIRGLKDQKQDLQNKKLQQQTKQQQQEQQQQISEPQKDAKIVVEKEVLQEETELFKHEAANSDSKETDAVVVVDDEDGGNDDNVEPSPSQEDEDDAEEESEEDEGPDDNDGTEDEDGEVHTEDEGEARDHTTPTNGGNVKKSPPKTRKRSNSITSSSTPGDVAKKFRPNAKNGSQNHGTSQNQNQPGQNKRKKETAGNANGNAGGNGNVNGTTGGNGNAGGNASKRKKRNNRGRGRPGRGRGK